MPVTAAPFLSLEQRQQIDREVQRRRLRRWTVRAAIGIGVFILLHFTVTRYLYRAPSAAALNEYGQALMASIVPLHSTARQPLIPRGVTITLTDQINPDRIRYSAEVLLHLAQPLYQPATSNGASAYQQMQESLRLARELHFKLELFGNDVIVAPEMPGLLEVTHRAGEALTVRVPFQARRFGWNWRIEPAVLALRTASRTFEGAILSTFGGAPHLVFGTPTAIAEMRSRIQQARSYVLAVNRAAQAHAAAAARQVPAGSPAGSAPASAPTGGADANLAPPGHNSSPPAPAQLPARR